MVFYVGRAPNGTKTCWKMNEYKAILSDHSLPSSSSSPPNQQVRRLFNFFMTFLLYMFLEILQLN